MQALTIEGCLDLIVAQCFTSIICIAQLVPTLLSALWQGIIWKHDVHCPFQVVELSQTLS